MDQQGFAWHAARLHLNDNVSHFTQREYVLLLGLIRARDLKGLVTTCDDLIANLVDRNRMRVLLQMQAFFKKNADFCDSTSGDVAALNSFHRAERLCRITNRRLDHYYIERDRLDPDLNLWMSRMELSISKLLGDYAHFLDSLPSRLRLTSGATSHLPRSRARPYQKISGPLYVTPASRVLVECLKTYFGYEAPRLKTTLWNRVTTVPKNWKTNRTIAAEPSGILPVQLAVDEYIKDRLRKIRIDLSFQSRNQELARESSITGSHATIDLSMASDTLSLNVINWLFPSKWRDFLMRIRSPYGKLPDGSFVKYAKFSSMGNGCTFTLETLVFAAACLAVGAKDFSVYGDDIIIETEKAPLVLRLLKFLGFIPNSDKTYLTGPFRESCGVNCYEGVDITPFYLREYTDAKNSLSHTINGLARIAVPGKQLWHFLIDMVVSSKVQLVPLNNDSLSGVFIDVHSAYSLGLIKTARRGKRTFIPKFKAYNVKSPEKKDIADSRGLFLWFIQKSRIRGEASFDSRSSWDVLRLSRKFRLKWVHWREPVASSPVHLYWWTEDVLRALKGL